MEKSMSTQIPGDRQASDLERWTSIIGGGAMVLAGLKQHSLRGILTAVAGGGLLYQGTTGKSTIKQAEEAAGLTHALRVEKTVTINRSPEDLYSFWRNLENLPQFMGHIKAVQVQDDRHSHWVLNGPLDQTLEWDAVMVSPII
jgi:uncharacterized membrane protein